MTFLQYIIKQTNNKFVYYDILGALLFSVFKEFLIITSSGKPLYSTLDTNKYENPFNNIRGME